jgi:hypothetical protein
VIVPATALYAIVCPPTTTLPSVTESGAAVGVTPPAAAAAGRPAPAPIRSCADAVEEIANTTIAAVLNSDALRLCRKQTMDRTSQGLEFHRV